MKQLIRKPHHTNDGCKEFINEISHLGSMKPTVTGGGKKKKSFNSEEQYM